MVWLLLIAGVIGNGINILIFLSVRTYRTTPCTFYFLVTSMVNMMYLMINLVVRIVTTGLMTDLTHTSLIWCKTRMFLVGVFSLTSFTCSCLATIDQFFVTSQNANLRRYSNVQWAYRIVFITIIVCCLHGIPCLIYFEISPISNACIITSTIYNLYLSLYTLILTCTIPVSIMVIFGYFNLSKYTINKRSC